mmetsp:Transcript_5161/g.7479  ORF Transcript_5161/g.7479 Transcript_5161/m.7479 type:complete len:132 (-) Transcript_5161:378-773(-)
MLTSKAATLSIGRRSSIKSISTAIGSSTAPSRSGVKSGASRFVCRTVATSIKDKSNFVLTNEEPPYVKGKHRSNALELIEKHPVIEVEGEIVVCDGGGGALGHPLEYISLERPGQIAVCIYCGLKFKSKAH